MDSVARDSLFWDTGTLFLVLLDGTRVSYNGLSSETAKKIVMERFDEIKEARYHPTSKDWNFITDKYLRKAATDGPKKAV